MTDLDEWFQLEERDDTRDRRWHAAVALTLALALVIAAGAGAIAMVGRTFAPSKPAADFAGDGTGSVQVHIRPGDSTTAIAAELQTAGVVKSSKAFLAVAASDPRATRIQPGLYEMRQHMSAASAMGLLFDPAALVGGRVTVPEGATEAKTLSIIEKSTTFSSHEISEALQTGDLGLPSWAKGHVEGFLYPSTYDVDDRATAKDLLAMMVARFSEAAKRLNLEQRAQAAKLKPYEVVIIASLIQAEVKRPEDYPMVSRVIRNRLAKGMKLQLDSTVNYALKTSKLQLSDAELSVNSPYNTYRINGLPPGPINSPDDAALEAALSPADGAWLYFVTTDPTTGETEFTDNLNDFNILKAKFQDKVR